jgi:hypothetical protein
MPSQQALSSLKASALSNQGVSLHLLFDDLDFDFGAVNTLCCHF